MNMGHMKFQRTTSLVCHFRDHQKKGKNVELTNFDLMEATNGTEDASEMENLHFFSIFI